MKLWQICLICLVPTKSFCCFSLGTGTKIISVIYMVFTGLLTLGLAVILGYYESVFKPLVHLVLHDIPINTTGTVVSDAVSFAASLSATNAKNIIVASIILQLVYFLLCVLLFIGASKEKSRLITPWLVAEFFRQLIFFAAFCFLAWFTSTLIRKWDYSGGILALVCLLVLKIITITFYFWLIVKSTWKEYRAKEMQVSPDDSTAPADDDQQPTNKMSLAQRIKERVNINRIKESSICCCSPPEGEEPVTKVEPSFIFQRLLTVIASGKPVTKKPEDQLPEEEFFKYELCSLPSSMFDNSGKMWSHVDSTEMAKTIASHCSYNPMSCAIPSGPDVINVVDGRSLIKQIPWKKDEKYASILERYLSYVINRFSTSSIIVFEGYNTTESVKEKMRMPVHSPEILFNLDMALTVEKDEFLSNKSNRLRFFEVLAAVLHHNGFKVLTINKGDADFVIAKATIDSAKNAVTVLISEDTDELLVLLLHYWNVETDKAVFYSSLAEPDTELVPKPKRSFKTWDISLLHQKLTPDVCRHLLLVQSYLGCATTSRLFGIGKELSFYLLGDGNPLFKAYADIFLDQEAKDIAIEEAGEALMLIIYGGKDEDEMLDAHRYRIFKRKATSISIIRSLQPQVFPPTSAATKYHSFRSYLQVQSWLGNDSLKPADWGWMEKNEGKLLVPKMSDLPSAPSQLLQAIKCNCKGLCISMKCSCRKYGLDCSILCSKCKGLDCKNSPANGT